MGLRRWLKVVYIGDPHVKAVLARKKTVRSKSVPKMSVFRKFKGLNIKYSYRDPKRHFLTRNDVLWRILRKYPLRDVGCSLIEEPKTTNVITSHIKRHGKMTYLGSRNPWTDLYKFCTSGAVPNVITHANFGADRSRGFGVTRGRILAFSIDLLRRLFATPHTCEANFA